MRRCEVDIDIPTDDFIRSIEGLEDVREGRRRADCLLFEALKLLASIDGSQLADLSEFLKRVTCSSSFLRSVFPRFPVIESVHASVDSSEVGLLLSNDD